MVRKADFTVFLFVVVVLLSLTSGMVSAAPVTQNITYQGKLTDAAGNPLTGTYSVTFKLYEVSSGGTALVTDTHTVQASKGLYNTQITADPSFFDGRALWLGIKVGADAEMTPRQELRPVPYALSLRPGAVINGNNVPYLLTLQNQNGNALRVMTTGLYSHGVYALTEGDNSDVLYAQTKGEYSHGVYALTEHDNSYGVYVQTSGNRSHGVTALTSGAYSNGVYAQTSGNSSHGVRVWTDGDNSDGVYAETKGPNSPAVQALTYHDNSTGVDVVTEGYNSYGLFAKTKGQFSDGVRADTEGTSSPGFNAHTIGTMSPGFDAHTIGTASPGFDAQTIGTASSGVQTRTEGNSSPGLNAHTEGEYSSGVYAFTSGKNSNGVYAFTTDQTSYGVHGETMGSGSHAVYAKAFGPSSNGVVAFSSQSPAIWAQTYRSDNKYGLQTPNIIRALNYETGSSDVGEYMPVIGNASPGTVLVIGEDGKLHPSTTSYDTGVAGIVSTAPGVSLGAKEGGNPGEEIIAVAGRVPCKVDTSNGPIHPRDLLTTSNMPGYAMKATDPKIGTVLGKAMGTLESGTGTIEVLVTLQ